MEANEGNDTEEAPAAKSARERVPHGGKGKGEQPEHRAIHALTHRVARTLSVSRGQSLHRIALVAPGLLSIPIRRRPPPEVNEKSPRNVLGNIKVAGDKQKDKHSIQGGGFHKDPSEQIPDEGNTLARERSNRKRIP